MIYQAVLSTPIGHLGLCAEKNFLTHIDFVDSKSSLLTPQTEYAAQVAQQLQNYFADANFVFNIALRLNMTPLQKQILEQLQQIPSGETRNYGAIAKILDTGPRVVGNTCRRNPIPVIIPCHRVVAANHLGGYSGATSGTKIDIKTWLLKHEQSAINKRTA